MSGPGHPELDDVVVYCPTCGYEITNGEWRRQPRGRFDINGGSTNPDVGLWLVVQYTGLRRVPYNWKNGDNFMCHCRQRQDRGEVCP